MQARPRFRIAMALLAAIALVPGAALAQSWPVKPVTLVVGTPAGGAVDAYARALADQLAKQTGGTFLVDNKPGANGNLSAEAVLQAPADGHTLWIGTQSMVAINPSAFAQMRWKPSDFRPIVKGIEAPMVLVAHPSVPAKTLPELAKWAAANSAKAAYASFSPGTPSHFMGFQLTERLKLDMVHVPYKGSAPQVAALVGGQVPLGFSQLQTTVPHVKAGKLSALAVTSKQRSRFLPEVPTLAELGYPEMTTTIWFGLLAPADTPKPVSDAIFAAAVKAQADPALRARLEAQSFDVPSESGDAFATSIAAESAVWARLVKATGFKAAN